MRYTPFLVVRRRTLSRLAALVLLPALLSGCAKYPDDRQAAGGKQIVVSMQVAGRIRPEYFYFVLINLTDDPNDAGPVPVVDIPWGNGFAAPAPLPANRQGFVGYVTHNQFEPQIYGVYRVAPVDPAQPDGPLTNPVIRNFQPLGLPDAYTPVDAQNTNTLSFRLDLARLPTFRRPGPDGVLNTPDDTTARYMQINLLATNTLPLGAESNVFKTWDALGDGRVTGGIETGGINTWFTISLDQNVVRRESEVNLEPVDNDVREKLDRVVTDPDLDIRDWTIEIRSR